MLSIWSEKFDFEILVPRKNGTHSFQNWATLNKLNYTETHHTIRLDRIPILICQDPLKRLAKGLVEVMTWQNTRDVPAREYPFADDRTLRALLTLDDDLLDEILIQTANLVWEEQKNDAHLALYGSYVQPVELVQIENMNIFRSRMRGYGLSDIVYFHPSIVTWPAKYNIQERLYKLFCDATIAKTAPWLDDIYTEYHCLKMYPTPW